MLLRILLYVFVFFAVSMPPATFASENPGSGVIINGRELTAQQVSAIGRLYKFVPRPGRYWYDTVSGAWGLEGHELQGFILTGHNFGPMAANASAGNTGVFFNGREINLTEALRIQQTFG